MAPVNPTPDKTPNPRSNSGWGPLLTLGWSLAAWMAGGTLLGRWADGFWEYAPWGIVSGALLGMAGCAYSLVRVVHRLDRDNTRDSARLKPPGNG